MPKLKVQIRFHSHCKHMLLKRSVSVLMQRPLSVHNHVVPSLRGVKTMPGKITSSYVFAAIFTLLFHDMRCCSAPDLKQKKGSRIVLTCRDCADREHPAFTAGPALRSPKNDPHVSWNRQQTRTVQLTPKIDLQQRTFFFFFSPRELARNSQSLTHQGKSTRLQA